MPPLSRLRQTFASEIDTEHAYISVEVTAEGFLKIPTQLLDNIDIQNVGF